MKKIVLTLVAVMSMTMAFAADDNNNATATAAAYQMNFSTSAMSRALELNQDQYQMVEDVNRAFAADMLNASNADQADRKALANEAIKKDLKYMRYILNNRQYRKYVELLNITINNRGLNK